MIFLRIHTMNATFGKLKNSTLQLKDGLNIIEAPNESGKSTWCAFLLSMLYGVNSRERDKADCIAEKNRYAPWTGEPMQGRIDCEAKGDELTLMRITQRPAAPMAEFRAVYAGTREIVRELNGQNCGEAILGVSREIYERSAFIRQSGLPIRQTAELERRIASLIAAGEENTSYSEAAEALKKQLNRRRHNKTGILPTLEAELEEARQQLEQLSAMEAQLREARDAVESQEAKVQALEEERELCELWNSREQRQALLDAQQEADTAREKAEAMAQRITAAKVPENEDIGRLRSALVNIQTTRRQLAKAKEVRDEALHRSLQADEATQQSPFAGQTLESAQRESTRQAPVFKPSLPVLLLAILWIVGGVGLFSFRQTLSEMVPALSPGLLWGAWGIVGAALALVQMFLRRRQIQHWTAGVQRRFGTTEPEAIEKLFADYSALLDAQEKAQEELTARSAAAESLQNAISDNEQALLLEIRRFAPAAFDLSSADELLRSCAVLRKDLAEAQRTAQDAELKRDVLAQQVPVTDLKLPEVEPKRPQEEVEQELEAAKALLTQLRSGADQLSGKLFAAGDPLVLRSDAEHTAQEIADLEDEYQSLTLALEALDKANAGLQSRFSPALGHRTAEIFRAMSKDRYQSVSVDRDLRLAVLPDGDPIQRDAQLLSAGAADQLYLAARLAISELVLPDETQVPLVLDDALANFDDERCGAALTYLAEAAKKRQIILFTCHSREADFFAGSDEVFVQRLTAEG